MRVYTLVRTHTKDIAHLNIENTPDFPLLSLNSSGVISSEQLQQSLVHVAQFF